MFWCVLTRLAHAGSCLSLNTSSQHRNSSINTFPSTEDPILGSGQGGWGPAPHSSRSELIPPCRHECLTEQCSELPQKMLPTDVTISSVDDSEIKTVRSLGSARASVMRKGLQSGGLHYTAHGPDGVRTETLDGPEKQNSLCKTPSLWINSEWARTSGSVGDPCCAEPGQSGGCTSQEAVACPPHTGVIPGLACGPYRLCYSRLKSFCSTVFCRFIFSQ